MPVLSWPQVAWYALLHFAGDAAVTITAITQPESGRNTHARNVTPATGDDSHGLTQVNIRPEANPQYGPAERLYDPNFNMRAAYEISDGGREFRWWTTWRNGLHVPHLVDARAGVAEAIAAGGSAPPGGAPDNTIVAATLDQLIAADPLAPQSPVLDLLAVPDPGVVLLDGEQLRGDLRGALQHLALKATVTGASTITLRLHDNDRALVRSDAFNKPTPLVAGGRAWRLVRVAPRDGVLSVTFEDLLVWALRQRTGPVAVAPGTGSRADLAQALCREAGVPCEVEASDPVREQIGRGLDDPAEDSWRCLQRLADDVQVRCFSTGQTVKFGSDAWLMGGPGVLLRERQGGVGWLNFTHDTGQVLSKATVKVSGYGPLPAPGTAVAVPDLGVATGAWLVAEIDAPDTHLPERTLHLVRARPRLVEPDTDVAVGDALTDATIGTGPWAGTQSIVEALTSGFDALGVPLISAKRDTKHTASGEVSDHWEGNDEAYAEDRSNAVNAHSGPPTPEMDRAAVQVMAKLGVTHAPTATLSYSEVHTINGKQFRVQVLYRTPAAGDHRGHLHVGVERR